MSRYTVVWRGSALDEMARIWLNTDDRTAITDAVSAIDSVLAQQSRECGVELSEGLRVLVAYPLRVIFSVEPDDCLVEVLSVTRAANK